MKKINTTKNALVTTEVRIADLSLPRWNPRKIDEGGFETLRESIKKDPEFLQARPVIASNRTGKLVVVAGSMRTRAAKSLGMTTIPTIVVKLTEKKEKEWTLKDNVHQGDWNWNMLGDLSEDILKNAGFDSEDMDKIFGVDERPEVFDLAKELKKLQINKIETKKGTTWQIGPHRIRCGDSMVEADMLALMDGEKAAMCLTDPPYILDYLRGKKKKGKTTEGFGLKRDRQYLGTDSLPDNFSDLWMANIAKIQKSDFSIIIYENPKNLRTIWNAMEKHWKYRNTIVWHLPNRVQGFAAKYKFFNKNDVALVGTKGKTALNLEPEPDDLFQQEYLNALYATSGKPQFEAYEKGKKICPTDFIEFVAADEKSSGQGIIFGTKPVEILIPYLKVLTRRDDLVVEPFCGSGSTIAAAHRLGRRCYAMEKSEVYAEVARRRIEKLTGLKAVKIHA